MPEADSETLSAELVEREALEKRLSYYRDLTASMIAVAAHDLRAPIANIFGCLSLLELDKDEFSETHLTYFNLILQAAQRLQAIADQLADLRYAEFSANKPLTDLVDLTSLVQEVFETFLPAAKDKGIQFELRCESASCNVLGDKEQLQSAVQSLIDNALKFTQTGGLIYVYLYRTQSGRVRFEVIDTGIGVPTDQQGGLFQLFFRVKNKQTMDVEGWGVGLFLVKEIVERHCGEVYFYSKPDAGSTFGFELKPLS
jgi:two-component system sensor histidine kinase NblS